MVSLNDKLGYYSSLSDKPKITSFTTFLEGNGVNANIPQEAGETDRIYFNLLLSFSNANGSEFRKVYADILRRKPSLDSAWIHDNFLIFVLLCGIVKFQIDKSWIYEVLQVRTNTNSEYQSINQTFKNLLNNNSLDKDNLSEIVIVFLDLLNEPQLPKLTLDKAFSSISSNVRLLDSKNDFWIIISYRAFEVIVMTYETPDSVEVVKLREFKKTFLKRARIISNIIYYLILGAFLFLSLKYMRKYDDLKDYVNDISAIFQIVGVAILVAFKWLRKKCEWLLIALFGYNKSVK